MNQVYYLSCKSVVTVPEWLKLRSQLRFRSQSSHSSDQVTLKFTALAK